MVYVNEIRSLPKKQAPQTKKADQEKPKRTRKKAEPKE